MVAQDDPRLANVGFAKLVGSGVELYAKKHEITMGRLSKSCDVDVVLGENMNISRQHARIAHNRETGQWELHVLGKNGVTLHGTLLTPENPPHPLRSQDMIQIAEKQFHFLLPKDPQWPAHGMVTRPAEQSLQQRPSQAAVQGEHNSSAHAHTADVHMRDAATADRRVAEVSALAQQGSKPPQQAQHAQQAEAQTSAPMSLPPSMMRIAAALPPVQQQVMMQQMALVMQKQMRMQQQGEGTPSGAAAMPWATLQQQQLQALQGVMSEDPKQQPLPDRQGSGEVLAADNTEQVSASVGSKAYLGKASS